MYHFSTNLEGEMESIELQVVEALKEEGFGVLTEIDIQATLKEKLGVDGRPYRILGAYNPPLAHMALSAEAEIGLLLPCNVVVREEEDETITVSFVDPAGLFTLVERDDIVPVAEEVRDRLLRVRDTLGGDFSN